MKQVDKSAYAFESYGHVDRWSSYYYQLREIFLTKPKNLLEVGVGDAVVKNYLKGNSTVEYTNVDVAEDLHPDVVGSVEALPFKDNSYDTVIAFEVLEHIPFEKFEQCLKEMKRVSKKYVLISLPHFGPPMKWLCKIPFLPQLRYAFKIPFPKKHEFNGQHHWEIGKQGYPVSKIREVMKTRFELMYDFVPFENQYHHFFILKKRDDK